MENRFLRMPTYRVFRLKDHLRQQFRWAPHLSGVTAVKPRDYEEAFAVEAPALYAAWRELRGTERALCVGDVLEAESGELRILKYIGFEEARWVLPEPKTSTEPAGAASDPANTSGATLG
jgi:hypothetical protein